MLHCKTEEIASTLLGKKVDGSKVYDPTLLVAVPRSENREQYNIKNDNLPFSGFDVWHEYEFSSMTERGIPVTRVLKIKYNCNSEFIVESKSLKLYMNSFNMMSYGKTVDECLSICKEMIIADLSKKLQTEVYAEFLDSNISSTNIYGNFNNIMTLVSPDVAVVKFKEAPEVLEVEVLEDTREWFIFFDGLKSNCRVTHQPDWSDAFIQYTSNKHIKEDSLLKYLVSFRNEWHFHEEATEMVFKRLLDVLGEDAKLFVNMCYTRRGGIDIWPMRYTNNYKPADADRILDIQCYARCGSKQ